VEEQQVIYGEERDARRALAEALLARHPGGGEPLGVRAARAGIALAEGYLVLALRLGHSPDEQDAGVTAAVAARRKVRRLQGRLDDLTGAPVLTLLDPGGGVALLPVAPDESAGALDGIADTVAALAKAAEAHVHAGAAWRRGVAGVHTAAEEAREVLRLALGLALPPGTYKLEDVLFEHALTSPPHVAGRLSTLLDPLVGRHGLIETLQAWYASDFDRRTAAADLRVHPNTLDYRLRRIAELTGIDPGTARGLQLLGAALTARRLGGAV
jgi:hypothetical protein